MKAWFENLEPRERLIVSVGGVAVVIILAWWLILTPLASGSASLRDAVTSKQRLLVNVRRAESIAPTSSAPVRETAGQSLVILVDATRKTHGLEFVRTRQDGADGINVSFQNVSFDALLGWLVTLDTAHGVTVETASFTSARERGLVNGQVLLRRR